MDIITKGQRIFKIHSNKIENDLNIGEVEFQKDKIEAIDDQFDKLKEKYLKLLLHLGLVSQIERHMNKKQSFELICRESRSTKTNANACGRWLVNASSSS